MQHIIFLNQLCNFVPLKILFIRQQILNFFMKITESSSMCREPSGHERSWHSPKIYPMQPLQPTFAPLPSLSPSFHHLFTHVCQGDCPLPFSVFFASVCPESAKFSKSSFLIKHHRNFNLMFLILSTRFLVVSLFLKTVSLLIYSIHRILRIQWLNYISVASSLYL